MGTELIKLFVPGYILQYFEYEKLEEMSGVIRIHLVEKTYSDPCVNLCAHCGKKTLTANKSLNRKERKELAKSAIK